MAKVAILPLMVVRHGLIRILPNQNRNRVFIFLFAFYDRVVNNLKQMKMSYFLVVAIPYRKILYEWSLSVE